MTASTRSLRQMKYMTKRRSLGLCAYGGCKESCASYYCPSHALKVQEKHRAWYARRVLPQHKTSLAKMIEPIKSSEPKFGEAI